MMHGQMRYWAIRIPICREKTEKTAMSTESSDANAAKLHFEAHCYTAENIMFD